MMRGTLDFKWNISIYGKRSSGKSRLMNNMLGINNSVVSKVKGTTTDPVTHSMELPEIGDVKLTDTAGIDDFGVVGEQRVQKTMETLKHTDLAVYIMDSQNVDETEYRNIVTEFEKYGIPHLLVFNKVDRASASYIERFRNKYSSSLFISAKNLSDIDKLKARIILELKKLESNRPLISDVLEPLSHVLLVFPSEIKRTEKMLKAKDSAILKEIIDSESAATVLRENQMEMAMPNIDCFSLIITDHSIYKSVKAKLLTEKKVVASQILHLRKKGDLDYFVKSAKALDGIEYGDKILFWGTEKEETEARYRESLQLIKNYSSKKFFWDCRYGYTIPKRLKDYSIIVLTDLAETEKSIIRKITSEAKRYNTPLLNLEIISHYVSGEREALEFEK